MPYIDIKTSAKATKDAEAAIVSELGKHISIFPGKSERWLMISLDDECRMAFAGTSEGEAIVEVKLFGTPDRSAAQRFTAAATDTVAKNLGISPDRVYVKYEGCTLWGVGGENF